MGDCVLDLFGNPVRDNHGKRGRPAFEVTERNRNKVKLLLACGWSNDRVANAIECSPATLKRYFRAELSVRDAMRDRLDAERMMQVAEQAAAGNVGAHRIFGQMLERNDQMEAERRISKPDRPAADERLGKKAERDRMAQDADADMMALLEEEATVDVRH